MAEMAETKAEHEARWWVDWFKADYSWEGLAKRKIRSGGQFGEQTLQDYWRRAPATGEVRTDAALKKAGELIEFDGGWWHLAHLPPRGRDGRESWKADLDAFEWEALDALVVARLAAAVEGPGSFFFTPDGADWFPQKQDGRARLDGAALRSDLFYSKRGRSRLHLSCTGSAFLGEADFSAVELGFGTQFNRAIFSGDVRFHSATFYGDASFHGATFSVDASFAGATFSGDATFNSATFSGDADFDTATFSGKAGFLGATFSGDADFDNVTFSSNASFPKATFSGDTSFNRVTFSGHAGFDSANFSDTPRFIGALFSGKASFDKASFAGSADFGSATFSGDARFSRTTFSGEARFHGATFSGDGNFFRATFAGDASFSRATFSSDARFDKVSFFGNASFHSATFSGGARFDRATFFDYASFYSAAFVSRATFFCAFKGAASFAKAVFEGPVEFSAVVVHPETGFAGAFYATRFAAIADFSRAVGPDQAGRLAAAFVETQFEKAAILTDGADIEARRQFRRFIWPGAALGRRFRRLRAICRVEGGAWRALQTGRAPASAVDLLIRCGLERAKLWLGKDEDRDARLRQLEAGCRTLKIAMGKAKDELREQRYYRFQLQARLGRSDIDGWEKAFGLVYRLLSDFGSSLWRPLLALVLFTALCGQGYAVWGASLAGGRFAPGPSRDFTFEGQGVALAALKPFATIEAPKPRDAPVENPVAKGKARPPSAPPTVVGVLTHNAAVTLGLRVATALQVVVSTLLVFLFALAVKRRFQIS
jgi:hypothetical protein